ncbi:MAG: hypothetical protein NTZ33_14395 [Bacteroidetes bacterium]|nr:hypothetical protein [Bacteroidota bacterium]
MNKSDNLNPTIISVDFIELSKIDTITAGSDQHHRIVTLKQNETAENIYMTPGSAQFNGEHQNSDEGGLKNCSLNLSYPGDGGSVPGLLLAIENKRGVVIFEYADKSKRVMGELDNPVLVNFSFSTQQKAYSINFEHKSIKLPYLLQV